MSKVTLLGIRGHGIDARWPEFSKTHPPLSQATVLVVGISWLDQGRRGSSCILDVFE